MPDNKRLALAPEGCFLRLLPVLRGFSAACSVVPPGTQNHFGLQPLRKQWFLEIAPDQSFLSMNEDDT
jgi:hypothetical protein